MKRRVLTAAVCVFLAGAARAWNVPVPEAHLIGSTVRDAPHGRIAGDFDLDGDPDLVIETTQTNLVWLKNVDAATSNWVGLIISSGSNDTPLAVADFDNDGDPDVLAFHDAIAGEDIRWYENSATGTVWTAHLIDANLVAGAVVANVDLGDLDRDGSVDVVISYQNAGTHLYWLVNNGTGIWAKHVLAQNVSSHFVVGDVNGDGNPDVMRMVGNTGVRLLNQAGVLSNWTADVVASNTLSASSFAMLDADQDGDSDMVTIGYSGGWFENTGQSSNWIFRAMSGFSPSEEALAYDVDGDGDDDVVAEDAWYDNPGRQPGTWTRRSYTNAAPEVVRLLGLADVDRDGDMDFLTQSVSNKLHWVELGRPALPVSFGGARTVTTNVGYSSDIEAADLDHDGDLDLVVSSFGGGLYWFESAGLGSNWTRRVIATNTFDFSAVAVADLDADGDLDVAASYDSGGQLLLFRNVGGLGTSWLASTVATAVVSIRDLKAGLLNADPVSDLAATVAVNEDVIEWRNVGGTATNWLQRFVTNDVTNAYGLDLGDLDRDGDPDIVATEFSGTRLRWFRNPLNNAGTNWAPRVITTNAPGYAGVALADLDGDGDLDVAAVSTQTDSLDLWINTDDAGQAWTNYTVIGSFTNPYGVIAHDFNRDGRMDLATTEAGDKRASIFYNLGGYTVWLRRNLTTTFTGTLALAAADLDDNGTTDLAVGASPGSSIVWFPKESYSDLKLTKTVKTTPLNFDAPVTFTLTVTNYGPDDAVSVVVTDALPAEIIWTNDTAGAGPPIGSNLVWNIGTLEVGRSVTCIVHGLTISGSAQITVTNRARLYFGGTFAIPSNAQDSAVVTIADLVGTVVTNFDGASDAAFVDWDGDGWADIVSCASNANLLSVHRNRGRGTNWTTLASIAFTNPTRIAVADFDRDGDADAAAISPRTGRIAWWSGPGVSAPLTVATGQIGVVSIEAADIDGDGDSDLLTAITGSTSIVWFQNNGGPATNWTRRVITAAAGNASGATAVDLDGDGDLDVAAVNTAGQLVRFMNTTGTGTVWSTNLISGGLSGASIVTAADLDGDGDADLVAGSRSVGFLSLWENTGAGGSWTQSISYLFHPGLSGIATQDWDGDGDTDLVTSGSIAGSVVWWENRDRRGRNWEQHELLPGLPGVESVALGDADHDGAPDFAAAVATADRIRWGSGDVHPWPGTLSDARRIVITNGWHESGAICLFDADADGDLDIASFSRSNKTIRLWKNLDRAGTRWSFADLTTSISYLGGLDHADLDGDGDEDLVSYPDLGNEGIWMWENTDGAGGLWTQRKICESGVAYDVTDSVISDLDRDGDLDIAIVSDFPSSTNVVMWFANGGAAGGAWSTNFITIACTNALSIDAGDLDRDGDPDLAVGGDEIYILVNNGPATAWTQQTMSVSGTFVSSLHIGDLDRNGTNDILYAAGSNIRLLRFAVPYTNQSDTFLASAFGTQTDIRALDFDADGDDDIVTISDSYTVNTGKVFVIENITTNATLTFISAADAAYDTVGGSELQIGDIDGDGDPDLAASFRTTPAYGSGPNVVWWPNRVSNTVAIRKNVSPAIITNPVTVAWTITVSNSLATTASGIIVTDWLPPGATWVSDTCGIGAPGTNAWTWNIGTLSAGATASCTITALVTGIISADLVNHALVSGDDNIRELATAAAQPDYDGDGLANYLDPDDDNDFLPDEWELLYGLNPRNAADALLDPDGDGYTNIEEYIALTNPNDSQNYFRLSAIGITNGVFVTASPMTGERRYLLEYTDDPGALPWTLAPGQFGGRSGSFGFLTNALEATNRFYRIRVLKYGF